MTHSSYHVTLLSEDKGEGLQRVTGAVGGDKNIASL